MKIFLLPFFFLLAIPGAHAQGKSLKLNTENLVQEYLNHQSVLDGTWRGLFSVDGQHFQVFLKLVSVDYSDYEAQKNPEFKDSGYVAGIYTLQNIEKRGPNDQCKASEEIHVPLRGKRFGNKIILEGLTHNEDLIYDATVVNIKLPLTEEGKLSVSISRMAFGRWAGKGGTEKLELVKVPSLPPQTKDAPSALKARR